MKMSTFINLLTSDPISFISNVWVWQWPLGQAAVGASGEKYNIGSSVQYLPHNIEQRDWKMNIFMSYMCSYLNTRQQRFSE